MDGSTDINGPTDVIMRESVRGMSVAWKGVVMSTMVWVMMVPGILAKPEISIPVAIPGVPTCPIITIPPRRKNNAYREPPEKP
jgi:hypothetical protein